MKYILDFFYLLIPNYGIAIILLTLVTKLVFLPLTFSSSESMAKMAALNPKMAEIRARLKDKPDKMNQEIAALYKREKVNPLSGCLPLLLQMPVFFALYNLLNSHFELRGAMFIPGWIPDLSVPEAIFTFPFAIPLVGWTALRALPLLMVASQLISSKFTQPSSAPQQGGGQAKLMMYALPIVFLFILYDMPSGLVLYWTVQNILSTVQQVYINNLRKKKDAQSGQTPVYVKAQARRKALEAGDEGPGTARGRANAIAAESGPKETDMIVKEFEGRNEKEAIDRAIEELGLDRNEIDFEIVEAKKPGILFRGGKVKIRVHLLEEHEEGEEYEEEAGPEDGPPEQRPARRERPRRLPTVSSRERSSSSPAGSWTGWGSLRKSR